MTRPLQVALIHTTHENTKTLGHAHKCKYIFLAQVDTLIANATIEDLRAITRNLLAIGTPSLSAAFTAAVRLRLLNPQCVKESLPSKVDVTGATKVARIPTNGSVAIRGGDCSLGTNDTYAHDNY
ncbi:hypothetical protein M405DRAFT_147460 [Rhizopogon salebrosus TDB-379]|nr:hypothetical protein M405DRAFT_147460 [Rhizopogon salebrosus TDB-379]